MGKHLSAGEAAQLRQVLALHEAGRNAEALASIAPLAASRGDVADVSFVHGIVLRAAGELDRALTALTTATRLDPERIEWLNALGNLLSQRGDYDTALATFDRLLSRTPSFRDGWLNKGLTAKDAGYSALAVDILQRGLRHFPGDARMLAAMGAAQHDTGDYPGALDSYAKAIAADPSRAITHHNHGVSLRAVGRFADACAAYRRAYEQGLRTPQLASNWAAALLEDGQLEPARELYGQAVAAHPEDIEAHKALVRLRWEYDGSEDAFAAFRSAVQARPGAQHVWIAYAQTLQSYGKLAEAVAIGEEARARFGAEPSLLHLLAGAYSDMGELARADMMFAELIETVPQRAEPRVAYARHLLRRGDPGRAATEAQLACARAPEDQTAWAYLGTAWRLLDDPREFWLHDYARFVAPFALESDRLGESPELFMTRMTEAVLRHHHARRHPGAQSLRHGSQTSGDIFARNDHELDEIKSAIAHAVRRYIATLPDDPAHPFLSRKTRDFRFSGAWSVRLFSSGFHVAHTHPAGWISSACYLSLPGAIDDPEQDQAGWIQFGAPPTELGLDLAPRHVVKPQRGRLVLFPASMWHGTIPFEDPAPRITLAFDALPA